MQTNEWCPVSEPHSVFEVGYIDLMYENGSTIDYAEYYPPGPADGDGVYIIQQEVDVYPGAPMEDVLVPAPLYWRKTIFK